MRRNALALALLTLLAGCAAPAADIEPTGLLGEVLAFATSTAMDQPTSGAEPNIAIAPDGTLWITAVAGSQDRPNHEEGAGWLWRSTDGGATWETLRAPDRSTPLGTLPQTRRPFASSDSDVVVSPDGHVYYTDWWNWGAPVIVPTAGLPLPVNARYGSYVVEHSSDGGATWSRQPITTLDTFGGMDRQWLVAGENGWVGLFYAYFHGPNPTRATEASDTITGRSSIMAVYSTDHGKTWTDPAPVVITDPGASEFNQISHPWLTPGGLLWMPHGWTSIEDTYWQDPSEVRVALSKDMGASWEVVKVADVPEGFDNLWAVQGASDADGILHVAWGARTGDNMTVFLSTSRDEGATWSAPYAVRESGLNFLPWVAAKSGGIASVAFYGSDATGVPDEAPESTGWFAYVAEIDTTTMSAQLAPARPEPVKVGPMCPRGASCQPALRDLLDYPSVAYAPDGTLHVSFAVSRQVNGANAGLVHHAVALTSPR